MEQVWNLERRMGACSSIPSIPSIPSASRTYTGARAYACACMCVSTYFSMEGMEVWKSGLNTGLQLSIPIPYLNIGMEGGFYG